MTGCPNSAATGCRCGEHAIGLAAYATDHQAYEHALAHCAPVKLRIVTMPMPGEVLCDGTMTCPCQPCTRSRVTRGPLGAGPAAFQVRAPRSQRAA